MEEPLTQDQALVVHNQHVAGTAMEHVSDASHDVWNVTDVFHLRRDFFHSRHLDLPFRERTKNWLHGSGPPVAAADLAEVGLRADPCAVRERVTGFQAQPERRRWW